MYYVARIARFIISPQKKRRCGGRSLFALPGFLLAAGNHTLVKRVIYPRRITPTQSRLAMSVRKHTPKDLNRLAKQAVESSSLSSQREVADRIGVTPQAVSQALNPPNDDFSRLAHVCRLIVTALTDRQIHHGFFEAKEVESVAT